MSDHRCPRCGTELKIVTVKIPVYQPSRIVGTAQGELLDAKVIGYQEREEVADCERCTGSY